MLSPKRKEQSLGREQGESPRERIEKTVVSEGWNQVRDDVGGGLIASGTRELSEPVSVLGRGQSLQNTGTLLGTTVLNRWRT